jgi:gamma-glutamyltranspeptidase
MLQDHADALDQLRSMGHQVAKTGRRQGDVHAIQVRDGAYFGAADQRLSGYAAGY